MGFGLGFLECASNSRVNFLFLEEHTAEHVSRRTLNASRECRDASQHYQNSSRDARDAFREARDHTCMYDLKARSRVWGYMLFSACLLTFGDVEVIRKVLFFSLPSDLSAVTGVMFKVSVGLNGYTD